jgi:hypothetical protein
MRCLHGRTEMSHNVHYVKLYARSLLRPATPLSVPGRSGFVARAMAADDSLTWTWVRLPGTRMFVD